MSQACPCGAPLGHHGSISVERLGVERCRSCADLPAETPGQTAIEWQASAAGVSVGEFRAALNRGELPEIDPARARATSHKQAPERRRR